MVHGTLGGEGSGVGLRAQESRGYEYRPRSLCLFLTHHGALGVAVTRIPGALLDDRLSLRRDDLLGAPVQLRVLDEAVAVGEPGAALGATVGLLTLWKGVR